MCLRKRNFLNDLNDNQEGPSWNLFALRVCMSFVVEQTDEMRQGRVSTGRRGFPRFARPRFFFLINLKFRFRYRQVF